MGIILTGERDTYCFCIFKHFLEVNAFFFRPAVFKGQWHENEQASRFVFRIVGPLRTVLFFKKLFLADVRGTYCFCIFKRILVNRIFDPQYFRGQ
jgi:hypothetical protein